MAMTEDEIRRALRHHESGLPVDDGAKARARATSQAIFDASVLRQRRSEDGDGPLAVDDTELIELLPPTTVDARTPNRFGRLAIAAAAAIIAIGAIALNSRTTRDEGGFTDTAEDGLAVPRSLPVGEFDASMLYAGLAFEVPADKRVTMVEAEPGRIMLRFTGASPTGDDLDVTILSVDRWGPPLVDAGEAAGSNDDAPASLSEWITRLGTGSPRLLPFDVDQADIESEFYWVLFGPGQRDPPSCDDEARCGPVALSAGGGAISLRVDRFNELIAIEVPGRPTLLVHTAYVQDQNVEESGARPSPPFGLGRLNRFTGPPLDRGRAHPR